MKIDVILSNLDFPEGPATDVSGNLWFVELHGGNVCCLSRDGALKRFHIENGSPNGIAVDASGIVWFCDAANDRISKLDPTSGAVETECDSVGGIPLGHPNDLAFDSCGNLLFTCPDNSRRTPAGYVCALSKNGVVKVISEKYFPNGLAFTADGKNLVIAETYRHRLWKGSWNPHTLEWKGAPWTELGGKIGPDGMAFAADGNLYVAVYGGKAVKIVSPDGAIAGEITTTGENPSNCAFAPTGGLFITETERGELLFADNGVRGARLFVPNL